MLFKLGEAVVGDVDLIDDNNNGEEGGGGGSSSSNAATARADDGDHGFEEFASKARRAAKLFDED